MKSLASSVADPGQAFRLVPGVSYFQVLELAPLVGPNGEANYTIAGPFLELAHASQFASARPGSLISVTLILHQAAGVAPRAAN